MPPQTLKKAALYGNTQIHAIGNPTDCGGGKSM